MPKALAELVILDEPKPRRERSIGVGAPVQVTVLIEARAASTSSESAPRDLASAVARRAQAVALDAASGAAVLVLDDPARADSETTRSQSVVLAVAGAALTVWNDP